MDCPWCGCGWLFICSRCQKAFTFAQAVEVSESWETTADRILREMFQRQPEVDEIDEWVEFMKLLLKAAVPGELYVYFDGYIVPTTSERVKLEGWHSWHDLDFVPQVAALEDPGIRVDYLCSQEYWKSHKIERSPDDSSI